MSCTTLEAAAFLRAFVSLSHGTSTCKLTVAQHGEDRVTADWKATSRVIISVCAVFGWHGRPALLHGAAAGKEAPSG